MHVNIRFKLILLVPLEIVLMIMSCFKSDFKDLERPRSTGDDLMHRVGTAFTMKMNSNDEI